MTDRSSVRGITSANCFAVSPVRSSPAFPSNPHGWSQFCSVHLHFSPVVFWDAEKHVEVTAVTINACLSVCRTVFTEAMQVFKSRLPWDLECVGKGLMFKISNGVSMNKHNVLSDEDIVGKDEDKSIPLVNDRLHEIWQKKCDKSWKRRVTYNFIKNVRFAEESED